MTPEEQKKMDDEFKRILFLSEKKFADNALLYFAEGYFALCVYIGGTSEVFVLTPYQVKRMARNFSQQIQRYEDSFGVVSVDLNIPSPIQQLDLKKPGDEEESGTDTKPNK